MTTRQDEVQRVYETPYNDALSRHFSRTASESLQDAERRFLLAAVTTPVGTQLSDLWRQYNAEQAFTSSNHVNDIKLEYWKTIGNPVAAGFSAGFDAGFEGGV